MLKKIGCPSYMETEDGHVIVPRDEFRSMMRDVSRNNRLLVEANQILIDLVNSQGIINQMAKVFGRAKSYVERRDDQANH